MDVERSGLLQTVVSLSLAERMDRSDEGAVGRGGLATIAVSGVTTSGKTTGGPLTLSLWMAAASRAV